MDIARLRPDIGGMDPLRAPAPHLLLSEWPRAAWTVASLAAQWWALGGAPRGDGRPVLVLPGLFNSDRSNFVLRAQLSRLGYRAYGWELGRNFGVRAIGAEAERLIARVEAIHRDTREPVTLIGVSLGGIMARIVAHRRPELVREVITVSAPYAGTPRSTNVWRMFEWLTGERADDPSVIARLREAAAPLPVPSTAIWSASDGLVNGFACHDPASRCIRVRSGHLGVQLKPAVLRAIAAVLAECG